MDIIKKLFAFLIMIIIIFMSAFGIMYGLWTVKNDIEHTSTITVQEKYIGDYGRMYIVTKNHTYEVKDEEIYNKLKENYTYIILYEGMERPSYDWYMTIVKIK